MHIYVASSWRNTYYPDVVKALRDAGHEVYDFRNPPTGDPGFHWTDVDPNCMDWTPAEYQANLSHPLAERQFKNDIGAMAACDACVLVLPCGRSAHTEAGWFAGQGKKVYAYTDNDVRFFEKSACENQSQPAEQGYSVIVDGKEVTVELKCK